MNASSAIATSPHAIPSTPALPDFAAIKTRQKATWASGDYAVVGTTLQIVGETVCESAELLAGERVLDVAAGNGNATLAAARRWCDVVSTDYVPALLERGAARASAEGLANIEFVEADAEDLPFEDASFDVVLSTFGCMFAPNPPRVAAELLRVCRAGGRIAMANWTPEGFIGQLFKVIGKHVPPPAGVSSPAMWGSRARIAELFQDKSRQIAMQSRYFCFRYRSAEHMLDIFRTFYGPTLKAFAALDASGQQALEADIIALMNRYNRNGNIDGDGVGTGDANSRGAHARSALVIPSEYLEIVVTRR